MSSSGTGNPPGGVWSGYSTEHRPLKGYTLLIVIFNAMLAGLAIVTNRRQHSGIERIGVSDLLNLGSATYKLSRLIVKDSVTSPLRAPFTEYQGQDDYPSEVKEKPRGTGLRLTIGELVT